MITEKAFYSVLVEHPNVLAAFDNAIRTMTNMARESGRAGIWAKMKLVSSNARAISDLLTVYGTATGVRYPASDADYVERFVFMAAKSPDRKFNFLMAARTGLLEC